MSEPHPLVLQLRFTRSEFLRGIRGVGAADARRRLEPMNCISWNVGHLAWQEQRYFLTIGQGSTPYPDIAERFASGGPPSTPPPGRGARRLAGDHRGRRPVARHADDGHCSRSTRCGRPAHRHGSTATCSSG